jgi:hypothetical protein
LTAGWFVVASLPALAAFPVEVAVFGICMAVLVQLPARLSRRKKKEERRFELSTLKMLLPLYAVYLVLLALWPTTVPIQEWELTTHFGELTFTKRVVFTFRFIEVIGAFTLFGYMMAELRGRIKESLKAALGWILLIVLGCSCAFVAVRAHPEILGSAVLETLLLTAAGLYGALIYRLQLLVMRR